MSRIELLKAMHSASSVLLDEKGYISFVDVLMKLGKLTKDNYELWRHRKVSSLEYVATLNLAQLNFLLRNLHRNCLNGRLRPSLTAYMSWGRGKKTPLRFSKSGDPNLEKAYATHFVRAKKEEQQRKGTHNQAL